ncbi:MAG TPA: NrfD/PsrC family molybdoenzyme membrane anchor subunit, partial [Thermoplasmata archaeon]|nr:NrfD/PsrC family molybdoenzyme membrane anchor subunit [Thermoplasmata archaeon]
MGIDESDDVERLLAPVARWSKRFLVFVAALAAVVAWGAYAYSVQLSEGLAVTGMRDTVSWGLYISNFVFFIGISHVGALMSAILRLTKAEWRRPVTRMAEAITVCSLFVGAAMPIIDLGRPDRLLNVLVYGRIQSAILWDFLSIFTYLTGSLLFFYLFLIPDLAIARDRLTAVGRLRRWIYRTLSLGWHGAPDQRRRLDRSIGVLTILILPIAISVHTVVSWIFAMTLRVGWDSTIFGPYFVAGALFSGVASVLMAMALFTHFYKLQKWITPVHFRNLAYLL